jgi:membrane associated rhomboid family serine protease
MENVFEDLKNSFQRSGNGLNQIIIINVLIFVCLILSKVVLTIAGFSHIYEAITDQIFLPASLQAFIYKPWTLITYFFVHESFFHILYNMIFLYWFGILITEFLGSKRLINLFILGGIAGGLTYLVFYNTIPFFAQKAAITSLLGASGGVFAVVIGAAVLIPDYTFFMIFLGPVKIKYIAGFYFLLSLAESIGPNAGGNIAHLGGALLGFIYIKQLKQGNDWGKPLNALNDYLSQLFKPSKTKIKLTYRNPEKPKSKPVGNVTQDEIDEILDKISKFGYEKLTKEEKQKLFKASQSTHI